MRALRCFPRDDAAAGRRRRHYVYRQPYARKHMLRARAMQLLVIGQDTLNARIISYQRERPIIANKF